MKAGARKDVDLQFDSMTAALDNGHLRVVAETVSASV